MLCESIRGACDVAASECIAAGSESKSREVSRETPDTQESPRVPASRARREGRPRVGDSPSMGLSLGSTCRSPGW
eukprot:5940158-Prymnesium_polylepis.1